jgi:hypothetical protein
MLGAAGGAVLVAVAALVIVRTVVTHAGGLRSGPSARAAAPSLVTKLGSVPSAVLDAVGVGTASRAPESIGGAQLTAGSVPRVLYVGAEYCSSCAAERWALAVALSRFGTFEHLRQAASAPTDADASIATLSFHRVAYTSPYLAFTGVELASNQVVGGHYAALDALTAADEEVFRKYDIPPLSRRAGAIPFVDLGGRYGISGAEYDTKVLEGKTQLEIATALSDADSAIAQAVDGTANLITAALCALTHGNPGAVCTSKATSEAAAVLAAD